MAVVSTVDIDIGRGVAGKRVYSAQSLAFRPQLHGASQSSKQLESNCPSYTRHVVCDYSRKQKKFQSEFFLKFNNRMMY